MRPLLLSLILTQIACTESRPVVMDSGLEPDVQWQDGFTPPFDAGPGGCATGSSCAADEYCYIETGCVVTGAKMGQCKKKPQGCDMVSAPVCGCDGKTYGNACMAAGAGVNVATQGGCGKIVIITDKSSYTISEPVYATLHNSTKASVWLQGCAAYSWEKYESGSWVDKGPTVLCGWEGEAREVKAGGLYKEDLFPHGPGAWRLAALYGVDCTSAKGQPLSSAGCASFATAHSDTITIGSKLDLCIDLTDKYKKAIPAAKKCDPAINMPQCTHKVLESLTCNCQTYVNDDTQLQAIQTQFNSLGCKYISGLPVCPPVACPDVQGGGCNTTKTCVDYLPD